MLTPVYIHSASCSKITNKPERGFYELCVDAGRKALENIDPLKIDSFYLASMDPAFGGATGELTAAMAMELGVMPRETLGIRGTSSAGGVGCIPSFKDVASGLHRYSLVISGEQMNRIPTAQPLSREERAEERRRVQEFLGGVIDSSERAYGLTMAAIGDMFESALTRYLCLSHERMRETIRQTTLEMYRRSAQYPFAHFCGNCRGAEDYDKSPWISPFYRRDDVVPISSGACAIVMASEPPEDPPRGRVVQVRGVGQGIQHPALTQRFGPVTVSPSVRRAIYGLLQRAGMTLEELRRAEVGFPHDAFPSIARIILKELGYGYDEALEHLMSGRFNPCGGLVKCGHPVGCSGELQLVRAFQVMTGDPVIPDAIRPPSADSAFTVSVGAALTNIVAIYIEAGDIDDPGDDHPPPDASYFDRLRASYVDSIVYSQYESAMAGLAEATGVVLAHTRTELGWVHMMQCRADKRLALADDPVPIGALAAIGGDGTHNRINRVLEHQLPPYALCDFGIIPNVLESDLQVESLLGHPADLREPVFSGEG